MPLCRDPRLVLPVLEAARPASESARNLVTGAAGTSASRIWVDRLEEPRAVIVRARRQTLFALDPRAAGRVVRDLPRNLHLAFGATPSRFRSVIRRNWPGRRSGRPWVTPCRQYYLKPGRLALDRTHRVCALQPQDAQTVVRFWPYGRSIAYVRSRILALPSVGIRRHGQLVAWGLTHDDGSMGFLHVLDECRGQGMARSVTTALACRLQSRNIRPFLYIAKGNTPSARLTVSMGFTRGAEFDWFGG